MLRELVCVRVWVWVCVAVCLCNGASAARGAVFLNVFVVASLATPYIFPLVQLDFYALLSQLLCMSAATCVVACAAMRCADEARQSVIVVTHWRTFLVAPAQVPTGYRVRHRDCAPVYAGA